MRRGGVAPNPALRKNIGTAKGGEPEVDKKKEVGELEERTGRSAKKKGAKKKKKRETDQVESQRAGEGK